MSTTETNGKIRRPLDLAQPSSGPWVPLTEAVDYENVKTYKVADEYPMADEAERKGLGTSINKTGIHEPIKLVKIGEWYEIADGRNRHAAAKDVHHTFTRADFLVWAGTLDQLEVWIYETNSLRRHMSAKQKNEHAERMIKKHPTWSTRKLEALTGVSKSTIANLKSKLNPKVDDEAYTTLVESWSAANDEQQERFVKAFKVDLGELLREAV